MIAKVNDLEHLSCQHYQELVAWCRRLGPSRLADAEDIVHGAYLRSRRTYRPDLSSADRPLAYLRRAIRSQLADLSRSERRRRKREADAQQMRRAWHELSPRDIVAALETLQSIRGRSREVCQSLLAGHSQQVICRDLKLSNGAFAVCLSRARAALMRAMA